MSPNSLHCGPRHSSVPEHRCDLETRSRASRVLHHRPEAKSQFSLDNLAITMLNYVLRQMIAIRHLRLLDYEHEGEAAVSARAYHER